MQNETYDIVAYGNAFTIRRTRHYSHISNTVHYWEASATTSYAGWSEDLDPKMLSKDKDKIKQKYDTLTDTAETIDPDTFMTRKKVTGGSTPIGIKVPEEPKPNKEKAFKNLFNKWFTD